MIKFWSFLSTFKISILPNRPVRYRWQDFSTETSAFANISDHLIDDKLIHKTSLVGPNPNALSSEQWSIDQPHNRSSPPAFEPLSSPEPRWGAYQETDSSRVSTEEFEEAWDLLQKLENSKSVGLVSKLKPSPLPAKLAPVFTPSTSLPVSHLAKAPEQSCDTNVWTTTTHLQLDFPSLEWRTRVKSRVKMDYHQLPKGSGVVTQSLNDIQSLDTEEQAWSFLEHKSNPPLTKSQVLQQARAVEVDPFAQEASRYVESWSNVMEFERQNEAITAMKRLYDIRRKSGNKYNPLGKSLVNMVVTIVEPPDFLKPSQKNDVYLRVERADETDLGLCNFRTGDHLLLSAEPEENFGDEDTGLIQTMPKVFSEDIFISCRLVLKRTYHLILRVENSDVDLHSNTYRLDYGWDGTSFDRMSAALQAIQDDPDSLRKNMSKKDIERGNIKITGTSLRQPLLFTSKNQSSDTEPDVTIADSPSPAFHLFTRDQRINSWAKRHLRYPPLKMAGDPDLGHLNEPQTRAIAMAISSPMSLIQGPPGTGKTQTIIQMVALLKIHFQVSQPVAICAPTHVSVDNLVVGLLEAGLKPVRCGEHLRVAPEVAQYSLETLELGHALTPAIENKSRKLESLTKDLDAIEKRWRNYGPSVKSSAKKPDNPKQAKVVETLKSEYKKLSYEVYMLKRRRQLQIIASVDVVCCTCLGAGASGLEAVEFASVIIDEAAMCHEPTALVPLTKGSAHTVLVGDHKQLPAITLSPAAESRGFGISLFERLQNQQNVPSILLHKQYRMHPIISAFPNAEFYHQELVDSIKPESIRPVFFHCDTFLEPNQRSKAVSFVTHNHSETKIEKTLINQLEAEIVLSILRDVLITNPKLTGHDIGIIAPYRGQVSLLQSLQRQPQKASLIGNLEQSYRNEVEINTVDGFQGREKPVIILSCVRGNDDQQIGFLADLRRFNVAATRAKQKFIIVGNFKTLKFAKVNQKFKFGGHYNSDAWRRWVNWAQKENLLINCEKFRGR
ncbi:hypothetical protein CROQUDRAFT_110938 [Cronartium quercuum f. sp. fusiforme G11]|uniref:P-loop containing nucleoside triphosphate hydrolase protein n=1 Tax=Cronartium quercuum f. sp. fusiforme G11 TaxID=708437 RepID=A0A9P6T677_9BASI|nr:hypothetical protein CROQUDRAFT_110938 [Cronartium quercuum f. sp. fusiforme G11]